MWKADIISCCLECCCHLSDCNHALLLVLRSSPSAGTGARKCLGRASWTSSVSGEESDSTLFVPSWTIPSTIYATQETPWTLKMGLGRLRAPKFHPQNWTIRHLNFMKTFHPPQKWPELLCSPLSQFLFYFPADEATCLAWASVLPDLQWKWGWEHRANEVFSVGGLW